MSKKYVLTEERFKVGKNVFYRIQAIRDFGDVKKGDLGGFVEPENNLSHEDTRLICDISVVRGGYAHVFEDAHVLEDAHSQQS